MIFLSDLMELGGEVAWREGYERRAPFCHPVCVPLKDPPDQSLRAGGGSQFVGEGSGESVREKRRRTEEDMLRSRVKLSMAGQGRKQGLSKRCLYDFVSFRFGFNLNMK